MLVGGTTAANRVRLWTESLQLGQQRGYAHKKQAAKRTKNLKIDLSALKSIF
jgi:hypothetical protein